MNLGIISLSIILLAYASGIAPSRPYPTAMNTSPDDFPVFGLMSITIPLLKPLLPTCHSIPVLVAYSEASYPSRSVTVITAIWFEVESSKSGQDPFKRCCLRRGEYACEVVYQARGLGTLRYGRCRDGEYV